MKSKYTHRQIIRVVVEAATPIAIGSGTKGLLTDAPVLLDVNGLPYIPGTSIAGVIRHAVGKEYDDMFGWQGQSEADGHGSDIIFSEARMIGKHGGVLDGITEIDWSDSFYAKYRELPIRQHVRISAKGTPEDKGKFDGQVVYKGTRFAFMAEYVSTAADAGRLDAVVERLCDPTVRYGGGTRKGFGQLKVIRLERKAYDLTKETDLDAYLATTSRLTAAFTGTAVQSAVKSPMIEYRLTLKPDDFYLFASGYGDDDADMTPMKEAYLDWSGSKPAWVERATLIPATSLKGALAHRTAYHWNKLNSLVAGTKKKPLTGDENPAVTALFGLVSDDKNVRGKVIFSDIIVKDESKDKVLPHVAIDRFTGGALDGNLFHEKATYGNGATYHTSIFVEKDADDPMALQALEAAIADLCRGLLPLGGGNNRGNGIFTGSFEKFD